VRWNCARDVQLPNARIIIESGRLVAVISLKLEWANTAAQVVRI
jgi:hypothetical protein